MRGEGEVDGMKREGRGEYDGGYGTWRAVRTWGSRGGEGVGARRDNDVGGTSTQGRGEHVEKTGQEVGANAPQDERGGETRDRTTGGEGQRETGRE